VHKIEELTIHLKEYGTFGNFLNMGQKRPFSKRNDYLTLKRAQVLKCPVIFFYVFFTHTMGAKSITRAKSIARGRLAANYDTSKVVFW
jgi:hypothetical protein